MKNHLLEAVASVDKFMPLTDFIPLEYGYEDCTINNWKIQRSQNYRYAVFFIKRGRGTFNVGGNIYEVHANQGIIFKPYESYSYEPDKKDPWYHAHVCFGGSLAYKFNYLQRIFTYDSALFDELVEICNKDHMVSCYLAGFLLKLCGEFSLGYDVKPPLNILHYNAAMLYINHHFRGDMTVDDVAKYMKLNRRYLARVFKSVGSISVQEILIKKRLELAVALLTQGESVTSVAEKTGYKDSPSFSKAFSKHFGYPPSKVKLKKRKN